jgi:hypothetical protein
VKDPPHRGEVLGEHVGTPRWRLTVALHTHGDVGGLRDRHVRHGQQQHGLAVCLGGCHGIGQRVVQRVPDRVQMVETLCERT